MCYWTSWASTSTNTKPSLCTNVIFSFVEVSSDGVLTSPANLATFSALKSQNPGVKFSFAIGGASYGENSAFKTIAASSTISSTFANNILILLQNNNLDGVDIDWEYPTNQATNFVSMLHILYNTLNPRGYLVTIAVGVDNSLAPSRYDIPNVAKYVDFINLMTYGEIKYLKLN
jgi:chitinase